MSVVSIMVKHHAARPPDRDRPERRPHTRLVRGAVVTTVSWKHWPCLIPQHGPGRKHDRPIVLEDWQRAIVEVPPGPFLRGLFHSDGCRAGNWTRKLVAGEMKRYDHPRWQFTNSSADIRELCCWALDLAVIYWRQASWKELQRRATRRRGQARRPDRPEGLGPRASRPADRPEPPR
jgi:hypothetical protein